jgi:putative transposase
MAGKRKSHPPAFKAQVALAAVKNDRTVSQLASQFGIHATLVHSWKRQLLQGVEQLFAGGGSSAATKDAQAQEAQLYEQIGRLKMELEWLKKKVASCS